RGDPLDATTAALLRRRRGHRPAVQSSAARGPGHRRPPGGDRRWPPGPRGMLDELTSEAGTRVVAEHPAALRAALDRHGIAYEQRAEQQLAVSLAPVDVGRLAVREQIVLTAL